MDDLIATSDQMQPGQAGYRDGGTGFAFYEDYTGIRDAIVSGSWIDGATAGIGAGLNVASTVIDPFSIALHGHRMGHGTDRAVERSARLARGRPRDH